MRQNAEREVKDAKLRPLTKRTNFGTLNLVLWGACRAEEHRDGSRESGGTALSAGLIMMAAQALFTILATRSGKAGMAGAAGLSVVGAGTTAGVLGETITYRVLYPRTLDPPKVAVVLAAIVLAPLMSILGGRRLRAVRSSGP